MAQSNENGFYTVPVGLLHQAICYKIPAKSFSSYKGNDVGWLWKNKMHPMQQITPKALISWNNDNTYTGVK